MLDKFRFCQSLSIEKSIHRLEKHLIGENPSTTHPVSSTGIIRFSVSSKSLPKYASLSEVTTAFFVGDYRAGYALDTRSQHWEELDPQGRRSIRNKFTTIKRAVKMVLLYADSYPETNDKDTIKGIATTAEKRLREALNFEEGKTLSIYKLEKQLKTTKELEKQRKLPDNTPDDIRKFFNNNNN